MPSDRRTTFRHLIRISCACLLLAACAGPGGNPDTADSANCDHGFLCGADVDGDGDGTISPTEWNAAYQRADANGDGQVSQGEFQAAGGNWGGGRGGR
jgi:hypothetical protein